MTDLNRFRPPRPDEEPTAECVNCGAIRRDSALMFDERSHVFQCDRECFDEWHDGNQSEVGDYYFENNVE